MPRARPNKFVRTVYGLNRLSFLKKLKDAYHDDRAYAILNYLSPNIGLEMDQVTAAMELLRLGIRPRAIQPYGTKSTNDQPNKKKPSSDDFGFLDLMKIEGQLFIKGYP